MNPTQSWGPLRGKIVSKLELDEECSNVDRKRQKASESNQVQQLKVCGFVFEPSEFVSHSREFLLSIPLDLRKLACEASILEQLVCLTSYTLIQSIEARQVGIIPLIEVHSGGMSLAGRPGNHQISRNSARNVWSLRQFRGYEAVFAEEIKAKDMKIKEIKAKSKSKGKEILKAYCDLYDIVATVDSVSPIISMYPRSPFALVELYDAHYPEETCTLVLDNQKDLIYWYGISPGDTIIMHQMRRKEFRVPVALEKDRKRRFEFLGNRIPSVVFGTVSTSTIDLPRSDHVPPIPATTIPLVSLEGQITHVETTLNSKLQRLVHWVVVSGGCCEGSGGIKLFLTHFPMDTALQLSLQVGARIRAVNIHKLCDECPVSFDCAVFGACLRSTVSIINMASEALHYAEDRQQCRVPYLWSESDGDVSPLRLHTQESQWNKTDPIFTHYPIPFHLKVIEISYHDYLYQPHIEKWLSENFRNKTNFNLPALPSGIDLVQSCRRYGHILQDQAHGCAVSCALRIPYAEFFDHGDETIGPNEFEETYSGCMMSRYDHASNFQAMFLGLRKIKSACIGSLVQRFGANLERDGNILKQSGVWSGSIHLQAHDILYASGPDCSSHNGSCLCTGGRVVETRSDSSTPASISDMWCQIPVLMSEKLNSNIGDFITVRIEKVVVSFLCIKSPKRTTPSENEDLRRTLSPVKTAFFSDKGIDGPSTLLRIQGYLLVASLHIVASKSMISKEKGNHEASQNDRSVETIASLLSDPLLLSNYGPDDYTSGIVLRHRFAPMKINPMENSQCCKLTICSANEDPNIQQGFFNAFSHLQTFDDVKLSIACPKNNRERFRQAFSCISGGRNLAEDECALGTCWWTLADSGRTCALTSGGWDELQPNCPQHVLAQLGIRLRIPLSSFRLGGRGYMRCAAHSSQVEAQYIPTIDTEATNSNTSSDSVSPCESTSGFHFLGCRRVYDGMLQHRPARRVSCGPNSLRTMGPLLYPPPVPTFDIAALFSQLCRSLGATKTNPIPLAPAMVRHISRATFLGVGFCKAQCFCTKCCKPLKNYKKRSREEMDQNLGILLGEKKGARQTVDPQPKLPKHIRDSALKCPEGHAAEFFDVRWECSGLLDDGTGQAKLYSDGEAALTLLGMDAHTIENIEEGIWSIPSGMIQFSKSMVPPESLKWKARDACFQNWREKRKNKLSLLEPNVRAEYLLHYHCRYSNQPRRSLEYFVKCKPLSDQILRLRHTTVESSILTSSVSMSKEYALETQDVATYSLPPLKLVLVDCAVPSEAFVFPETF